MLKKYSSAVIFWGALWGIEEATLGHLLHVAALNIGWFLWFPSAWFFMSMVYKKTGRLYSILFTSMVAATIKLVDLFVTTNPVIVICPALSILLEGISLFAILTLVARFKNLQKYKLAEIISVSLLWRILYLAGLFFISAWIMSTYSYKSVSSILKFLLYEGLLNSLLIYITMLLAKKITEILERNTYFKPFAEKIGKTEPIKELYFSPVVSLSILAVALIIQWVF